MIQQIQSAQRQRFLDSFLRLLGADSILWKSFEIDKIHGTVIYDPNDPYERQDFCWHMTEDNIPSEEVFDLINFIRENNLIDVDKITVPFAELFLRTKGSDFKHFMLLAEELTNIKVRMVDDGEETDTYFVHD